MKGQLAWYEWCSSMPANDREDGVPWYRRSLPFFAYDLRRYYAFIFISALLAGLFTGLILVSLIILFNPESECDSQHSPRQRSEHTNPSDLTGGFILLPIQSAKPLVAGQNGLRTIGWIFGLPDREFFIRHAGNGLAINAHEIADVAGFPDTFNHI